MLDSCAGGWLRRAPGINTYGEVEGAKLGIGGSWNEMHSSKASANFTGDWVTYCWPWLPQEGVTTLKRQLSLSRRGSPPWVISRPHSKQGVGVGERLCPQGGEWGPDQPGSVHHRIPKPDRSRSQRSWMFASAEKTASMEWEEAPAKSELKKVWKRITGTQRRYREMKTAKWKRHSFQN